MNSVKQPPSSEGGPDTLSDVHMPKIQLAEVGAQRNAAERELQAAVEKAQYTRASAKQAEIEQMGQSMAALGAKLKKLSAGDKRQPQRAALTARVEREEQAKEKLRKAQAQCKHMQAQLAERTRQLQLHTSGAIENDAASPNVPRGVPRRGLGPGSVEVVKRDGREADVMRRTLEATRVPSLTPSLAPQPVPPPSASAVSASRARSRRRRSYARRRRSASTCKRSCTQAAP